MDFEDPPRQLAARQDAFRDDLKLAQRMRALSRQERDAVLAYGEAKARQEFSGELNDRTRGQFAEIEVGFIKAALASETSLAGAIAPHLAEVKRSGR